MTLNTFYISDSWKEPSFTLLPALLCSCGSCRKENYPNHELKEHENHLFVIIYLFSKKFYLHSRQSKAAPLSYSPSCLTVCDGPVSLDGFSSLISRGGRKNICICTSSNPWQKCLIINKEFLLRINYPAPQKKKKICDKNWTINLCTFFSVVTQVQLEWNWQSCLLCWTWTIKLHFNVGLQLWINLIYYEHFWNYVLSLRQQCTTLCTTQCLITAIISEKQARKMYHQINSD